MNLSHLKHIKEELPPYYKKLKPYFKDVIPFVTIGDTLYNPGGHEITSDLLVHENVHARQQEGKDLEKWVDRYLTDTEFRKQIELEAYREQYKADGNLDFLAHLLSGMYNLSITKEDAKRLIAN